MKYGKLQAENYLLVYSNPRNDFELQDQLKTQSYSSQRQIF